MWHNRTSDEYTGNCIVRNTTLTMRPLKEVSSYVLKDQRSKKRNKNADFLALTPLQIVR